jgi:hypothetical protein
MSEYQMAKHLDSHLAIMLERKLGEKSASL